MVDMKLSVEVFARPLCLPNLEMLTFDQPGGDLLCGDFEELLQQVTASLEGLP